MFGKKKGASPEFFSEENIQAVDDHISEYFGECEYVFHETLAPGFDVDICIIEPTPERNHITLVTLGMCARRMNVPQELTGRGLERAELLMTLPPGWNVEDAGEEQWPLWSLKMLARFPGEFGTWLGYGHTVPNGYPAEPFSDNTQFSALMLAMPGRFAEEAAVCPLPDGGTVRFYQVMPLYDDEMDYKREHGAEALERLFGKDFDMVVDAGRDSVVKYQGFPFSSPENTAAVTCSHVLEGTADICYVSHDEDGDWQFLCGDEEHSVADGRVAGLGDFFELDPTVGKLAGMPIGLCAVRENRDSPWRRLEI